MTSTRAIFASIGASAALVTAFALCLLTVSAIVALQGWPGLGEDDDRRALVVDGSLVLADVRTGTRDRRDPVVLLAPRAPRPVARSTPRPRPPTTNSLAVRGGGVVPVGRAPAARHPAPTPSTPGAGSDRLETAPVAAPKLPTVPESGDAVREVGEGVSSGVQDAGKALSDVTSLVSPPVAQAVEDLAKLVAALLERTTRSLGGSLDLLQKPQ